MLNKSITNRRLATAVAMVLSMAHSAWSAEPEEKSGDSLTEVVVTGSRIAHATGMTTPTPVAALSANELSNMAPASITEALTQLPQFYGSATDSNFNSGGNGFFASPGGGSLNLRGIGTNRTLTLLDGRRVVPASIFGGPDINMFPEAMLSRVETVTGGASAAYGTDAVSGVVNYILDTKFEGFRGHAQNGHTARGDGANEEYSVSVGHQLTDRMHALFSASHSEQDPIETIKDREWYQGWALINNADATNANISTVPRYRLVPQVKSRAASYDGIIQAWQASPGFTVPASFGPMTFNSDGTVSPFVLGNVVSSPAGLQHSTVGGGSGTDNNLDRFNLLPRSMRSNAFTYLDFDIGHNTTVYVQGMYSDQVLRAVNPGGGFTGSGNPAMTIYRNNAFLPKSLNDAMIANNIASFTFGRIGHSSDIASDAHVKQSTKVFSGTTGFKTKIKSDGFFSDWNIDGYYQYGKSDVDAAQQGGIRLNRIYAALDAVVDPATGRTVCNVTLQYGSLPDCVPLNLFGRGNASKTAIDWVVGFDPGVAVTTTPYLPDYPAETYSYIGDEDKHRLITLRQDVFELTANGKVAEGWAGPISVAFGSHYRKESVDQRLQASQGNSSGDPNFFPNRIPPNVRGIPGSHFNSATEMQNSRVTFVRGAYDIKEVFAETLVPLVSGLSWLKNLNFNGALRWADYAGSGSIYSYKGGLDAAFTDEIRVRGTYSRDVRAAGMNERFDRTGGSGTVTDDFVPNPTVPGTYLTAQTYGVTVTSIGNPSVSPESADTVTAGFVYQPRWLPGFDVSVDWLNVSIKDAIERYSATDIVDRCQRRGQTDLCKYILPRDTTPGANFGRILFVDLTYLNLNEARLNTVDLEMAYSHGITVFGGGERLGLRLFTSWLGENSTTSYSGAKTDLSGDAGAQLPTWKATGNLTYSNGPVNWSLQARYIGGGKLSSSYNTVNPTTGVYRYDVERNRIGSIMYMDTRLSYNVPVGSGEVEVFGNITNLLDRDPPIVPGVLGSLFATSSQYSTGYDALGRRFTFGVNLKF